MSDKPEICATCKGPAQTTYEDYLKEKKTLGPYYKGDDDWEDEDETIPKAYCAYCTAEEIATAFYEYDYVFPSEIEQDMIRELFESGILFMQNKISPAFKDEKPTGDESVEGKKPDE